MTEDYKAITGHVAAALEHIESALRIERDMNLPASGLAKVLQQAKRTTSRVVDELDLWVRFAPPSESSEA